MDALIVDAPEELETGSAETTVETPPLQPVSLEAAELELALQAQDIFERGFAGAVRHALDALEGTLLFDMPDSLLPGFQRVAAVSTGSGGERRIFLIHLADDGGTVRVEEAAETDNPLAGFASSCMNLMDRLAA